MITFYIIMLVFGLGVFILNLVSYIRRDQLSFYIGAMFGLLAVGCAIAGLVQS